MRDEQPCWINVERMREAQKDKTPEEIGREWRDANLAAAEGRWEDCPDWMAPSIDGNPGTGRRAF